MKMFFVKVNGKERAVISDTAVSAKSQARMWESFEKHIPESEIIVAPEVREQEVSLLPEDFDYIIQRNGFSILYKDETVQVISAPPQQMKKGSRRPNKQTNWARAAEASIRDICNGNTDVYCKKALAEILAGN